MTRLSRARALYSLTLSIIAACLLTACGASSGISSLTSEAAKVVGVYDNASKPVVYDLIDEAKERIDIEIYEMRDPKVRAALKNAASRGVKVRIVIEPKPVGVSCEVLGTDASKDENCSQRRAALKDMAEAGIDITPFSKQLCGEPGKHCFQHGKLLIADSKKALISTGNFNSSSLCNKAENPSACNRDFSVVLNDKSAVDTLEKVFEQDRQGVTYDLPALLTPAVRSKVTISPHALPDLTEFIARAQKSIEIQAQYLKEPKSNEALIAAAKRGVKVSITLSSLCSFTSRINERAQESLRRNYQPLIDAGADVRFYTKLNKINDYNAYMHAKAIVIDERAMWIGSINGSTTSFTLNREFGVFVDDADEIKKISRIIRADHTSELNERLDDNLKCKKEANMGSADRNDTDRDDDDEP